jgi:hypothetical protein
MEVSVICWRREERFWVLLAAEEVFDDERGSLGLLPLEVGS